MHVYMCVCLSVAEQVDVPAHLWSFVGLSSYKGAQELEGLIQKFGQYATVVCKCLREWPCAGVTM